MSHVLLKLRTDVAFAATLRDTARQAAEQPSAAQAAGLSPELVGWMLEVARAIEETHKHPRPELRAVDVHDEALPMLLRRQAE